MPTTTNPFQKRMLDSILEAAKYAPTARNLQELECKAITNKDLTRKISERITAIVKQKYPSIKMRERSNLFYDAPLLIIITGPKENIWIYSDAALAKMEPDSCSIPETLFHKCYLLTGIYRTYSEKKGKVN